MVKVLIAFAFVIGGIAHAADSTPDIKECKAVKKACKGAEFSKGAHKEGNRKGLFVDCMMKLAKGEKVEGVDIDPADPAQKPCFDKMIARHDAHKAEKAAAKAGATAPTALPAEAH